MDPAEDLEESIVVFGRNADAVVFHNEADGVRFFDGENANVRNCAGLNKLAGIGEKV